MVPPSFAPRTIATRRQPILAVLGLLLVIAAAVVGWYALRDHRAVAEYRGAPVCASATPNDNTGCRRLVPATIAALEKSPDGATVTLRIDKPAQVAGGYRLPGDAAILIAARPGDPVTAELWEGRVAALDYGGRRSDTANAPASHWYPEWSQLLALAGLAFLLKFALRTVFPVDRRTGRVRDWDWRSIVYGLVVLLAYGTAFSLWLRAREPGWLGGPLLSTLVVAGCCAAMFGIANLCFRYSVRRATTGRPTPRLRPGTPGWGVALLVVGGCLAAGAVTAAFVSRAELAANRAAAALAPCAPGTSGRCLREEDATVVSVDADGGTPSVYIQATVRGYEWVYFPASRRPFVRSLSYGQLLSLGTSGDRVVTVSVVGQPTVAKTDESPFIPANLAFFVAWPALVALIFGIRLCWPSPGNRRLWTEIGAGLVLSVAIWACVAGRAWWPYAVVASLLLVLVTVPSWRQPADRVVSEG